MSFSRRSLMAVVGLAGLASSLGEANAQNGQKPVGQSPKGLRFGTARPFSFDTLKQMAKERAQKPYSPPPRPNPEAVQAIDYDAHGKLKYRQDFALFGEGAGAYPVTFQHVGRYFPKTVKMHVVDKNEAREILYSPQLFTIAPDSPAAKLTSEASAFAGLWVQESRNKDDWKAREPWLTFLGASYFRAVGELGQVGLSARGLALSPGQPPGPEEFPDFTSFWVEAAANDADPVTIYALLDSPSVTGAYKFLATRGAGVVLDIEVQLNFRAQVNHIGLAPLTSMYWFSETTTSKMADWRPEVHDSDGLSMWTGTGEYIWRPLNNPPHAAISSFADKNPKGFGLSQRDREFLHYLDGVKYEKRPSAWVEPVGEWGEGFVQLVELPTNDEIHDNIVALWLPKQLPEAGHSLDYRYKLHWLKDEPYPTHLARVVATRMGRGGQPGQERPEGARKFLIEFLGGPLANLPKGVIPQIVFSASRGIFGDYVHMEAVPNDVPGHWRAQFDLAVEGREPVEMRAFLKVGDQVASETWLYQFHPE